MFREEKGFKHENNSQLCLSDVDWKGNDLKYESTEYLKRFEKKNVSCFDHFLYVLLFFSPIATQHDLKYWHTGC